MSEDERYDRGLFGGGAGRSHRESMASRTECYSLDSVTRRLLARAVNGMERRQRFGGGQTRNLEMDAIRPQLLRWLYIRIPMSPFDLSPQNMSSPALFFPIYSSPLTPALDLSPQLHPMDASDCSDDDGDHHNVSIVNQVPGSVLSEGKFLILCICQLEGEHRGKFS